MELALNDEVARLECVVKQARQRQVKLVKLAKEVGRANCLDGRYHLALILTLQAIKVDRLITDYVSTPMKFSESLVFL